MTFAKQPLSESIPFANCYDMLITCLTFTFVSVAVHCCLKLHMTKA